MSYTEAIHEAVPGLSAEDARTVEELMRVERPTLDALDRRQFNRLARQSKIDLDDLRKNDPEVASWYEQIANGGRS